MNDSNRIKHEPAGFDRAPRRLLPLAAAIALSTAALAGCSGGGTVDATATAQASTSTEPETTTAAALPNPMREVTDVLAFETLGVHMVAPAKGENVRFFIINDEVADMEFQLDGVSYTWRASNTAADFAGIFERFREGSDITVAYDAPDASSEAVIRTTESGGRLSQWKWGKTNYTLHTASEVDDSAITDITKQLMELSLHEN